MSTLALTNTLTPIFVALGITGAAIAVLSAVVIGFALARGAAGLAGGAAGGWIFGAMLSVTGSFAAQWTPLVIAGVSLVAALVLGAALRAAFVPVARRVVAATTSVRVAPAASSARPASRNTDVIAVA